jgi:hypothetical protein
MPKGVTGDSIDMCSIGLQDSLVRIPSFEDLNFNGSAYREEDRKKPLFGGAERARM